MVPARYNRSPILNFNELSDDQQKEIRDTYFDEESDAYDTGYVLLGSTALPLCLFMRIENSKMWDGMYSTSAFSAYFVKFSTRFSDEVLVAERYC